jgi:hypothetical protein
VVARVSKEAGEEKNRSKSKNVVLKKMDQQKEKRMM